MLAEPQLDIDRMVPKKETFSVPQFGQGPLKIKKSFTKKFVIDRANHNMSGNAANHVKMKLNGSGSSKRYVISNPVKSSRKKNNVSAMRAAGTFKRNILK